MRLSPLALLPALLAACGEPTDRPGGPPGSAPIAPPAREDASLLLVTLDTFRADAAGCGGHPNGRTPWLDRLARQGLQLDGIASTPMTLPSHTSMLTGLDPPAHGVRDNGVFRVPASVPTLAEALRDRGVGTAAFVAAFPLEARFGLARGFDSYDDEIPRGESRLMAMAQRPGDAVVAAARTGWTRPSSGRRFVWVHLYDAHKPHDAPPPLIQACGDDYVADVAWTDHWMGAAVRDARQSADELWVVVVGDHGEARGDHGEATHGVFVYGSTMRVPAVIWPAPDGTPRVGRDPFRLIDVPATVFDLLGFKPAEAPGAGASVLGDDPRPAYMESWYALYHYGWAPLTALREGDWKYVSAPQPELYDLSVDPGETDSRIDDEPDLADAMEARLRDLAEAVVEADAAELDEDARAALESLGYATGSEAARTDLPDPKRMIVVQNQIEQAQAFFSAGRMDLALGQLRAALSRDPRNKDVHLSFGIVYTALGRDAEAADSFRRCLELPPHENDRVPRFELASALLRLGKPAAAAPELEIILETDSDDADSWYNLGVAYRSQGHEERARAAFERALQADPAHELTRSALGRPEGQ